MKSMLCLLLSVICSAAWAQAVIFPQEEQPGRAVVTTDGGEYTIGNDLFEAKFIHNDEEGTLTFGGCEAMGLLPGGDVFKVQLADGTEIPSTAFTLSDITTEVLTGESSAVKASRRYHGVQIKAQFVHENGLGIEWRAVLRDGSHYLRTEVDIVTTTDIAMYSITPMMYTVENADGQKAPAVVGNTRGAVIASDKIFAGLETPMGIQKAGRTTDIEAFAYKGWAGPTSWAWAPETSEIPQGVTALEQYVAGTVDGSRGYVIFREKGECVITIDYTGAYGGGNSRLQTLGVDIVGMDGTVVDGDYHYGSTGTVDTNNSYTLDVPETGAYMVRIFVTDHNESYYSQGNIIYSTKVALPELVYDLPSTGTPYWTSTGGAGDLEEAVSAAVLAPGQLPGADAALAAETKEQADTWEPADFGQLEAKYIPKAVTALHEYLVNPYVYATERTINAASAGRLTMTFVYNNGASRGLDYAGVEVLDAKGNVLSADYHMGFTGGSSRNNAYTVTVPAGVSALRIYAENGSNTGDRGKEIIAGGYCDFAFTTIDAVDATTSPTVKWTNAWTGFAEWTDAPEGLKAYDNATKTEKEPTSIQFIDKDYYVKAGKLTVLYDYTGGSHGLHPMGVALMDAEGNIVTTDYHAGFTGGQDINNVYTLNVMKGGNYTVRFVVDKNSGGTETYGTITLSLSEYATLGTIEEEQSIADSWTSTIWTDPADTDVPMRVVETGCTAANARIKEQVLTITSAGTLNVEFSYKSGNLRLDIAGVDIVDAHGNVVANDYHAGYTGNAKEGNVYSFDVPQAGTYLLRYYVNGTGDSSGDIALTFKVEYTLHLIAPKTTPITGMWRRQTTLCADNHDGYVTPDEMWNVSAVVGLIAPRQARRSFLCYSERERAVPWRAVPVYISWYELNIERNNAAPGNEHENMTEAQCLPILNEWKTKLYDAHGEAPYAFVWDDGWDTYGEWKFHSGFPNGFTNMDAVGRLMNAGQGAWLGPVGGYGQSGSYRRNYWSGKGGMQLSNDDYYQVFLDATTGMIDNYDFRFFKFDGISGQFSSVGPDAGATGEENAEAIISAERTMRTLKEDIFINTTVGTWASPFWFQFTDAVWRQENDHGRIGNNNINRENWITYRDRLVYLNFVQNSPLCPINTLMTHGFMLTQFGPPAGDVRDYDAVVREMRCAFACGSGMVELYNDYALMNAIEDNEGNAGALWGDLAECMQWQRKNADVLPDIHWVGGNPWTGAKAEIYGWAAWNAQKAVLTLRNGANGAQDYTFTLREALDIPDYVKTTITLTKAFADQAALTGLTEGEAIDIDTELTVTLPGSTVYIFDGVDGNPEVNIAAIIGAEKVSTFYANEAVCIPEGVKAYVAYETLGTDENEAQDNTAGTVVMTKIEDGIIPAKTGVLICGEQGTYTFTGTTEMGETVTEFNLMKGYAGTAEYETVALPQDGSANYVLVANESAAHFCQETAAFKVYKYKAYLQLPTSIADKPGVMHIKFGDDEATAIELPSHHSQHTSIVYDLTGRRVVNPAKGVYIVKGKKVVIK